MYLTNGKRASVGASLDKVIWFKSIEKRIRKHMTVWIGTERLGEVDEKVRKQQNMERNNDGRISDEEE